MATVPEILEFIEKLQSADPRPVKFERHVHIAMQWLEHSGFIAPDLTDFEKEHLARKFTSWTTDLVHRDRADFHKIKRPK